MSDDNRRETKRQRATVKLQLKSHDLNQFKDLYTENVGNGGIFVRSKTLLPVGEKVSFEILINGRSHPLSGEALVVWVREANAQNPTESAGMGLQFVNLSEESAALFTQIEEAPIDLDEPISLEEEIVESDNDSADNASDSPQLISDPEPKRVSSKPSFVGANGGMMTLPTAYSIADTVIGIDLGTSNSCVSVIHSGKPYIIPTESNDYTVPSVISYAKNGSIIVGKTAKDQLCIDPKNTIYGAKRFIGRPFTSPIVQNLKDTFPYEIIPGEKGQVAINVRGEVVNLETVSSHILNYLKLIAQEFTELEVSKAVITVPAYYNDNQRQAVKEAGRMAGLDVQRIVNEPTAAALAYGFNRGFKTRILVYDLGGGTFDVSILELSGNSFQVVACGGNNFLGGEDFDNVITDHLISIFEKEQNIILLKDRIIRERIKQGAEFAKRTLSEAISTTINIPYLKTVDNKTVKMQLPLTRETLNKITKHLIERTLQICDEVMNSIGFRMSELDDIILVGGQTRMPLVRKAVEQHFKKTPRSDINPDEVVAIGAALLGAGLRQGDNLKLRDTISISIGIALPGGRFKPVIRANEPVPTMKNYKVGTKEGQDSFTIDVFQGESSFVHENEYLGTLLFSDLPVGQKGESKMNIEFQVTEECILKVTAVHPESGKTEEALLVTYDTPPSIKQVIATQKDKSEPNRLS